MDNSQKIILYMHIFTDPAFNTHTYTHIMIAFQVGCNWYHVNIWQDELTVRSYVCITHVQLRAPLLSLTIISVSHGWMDSRNAQDAFSRKSVSHASKDTTASGWYSRDLWPIYTDEFTCSWIPTTTDTVASANIQTSVHEVTRFRENMVKKIRMLSWEWCWPVNNLWERDCIDLRCNASSCQLFPSKNLTAMRN